MTEKTDSNLIVFALGGLVAVLAFSLGIYIAMLDPKKNDTDKAIQEGLVLWPNPPSVADFHLKNQLGEPFTRGDLLGKWTMLFFGFANCPDVCPSTLNSLAAAYQTIPANSEKETPVQMVFVSVDPRRDTMDVLKQYVQHFSEHLIGVTGDVEQLSALSRSVGGLFLVKPQSETAPYTVDHSAGIFFISPSTDLVSVLTPPVSKAAILERLKITQNFFVLKDL